MTLFFGSTTPLAAQASLTENDIQRLQLAISDARADVDRLGSSNDTLSDDLRKELDNLSDEAIYLKVRMRKEHMFRARTTSIFAIASMTCEYARAAIGRLARSARQRGREQVDGAIPVGTELDVRLEDPLSSKTNGGRIASAPRRRSICSMGDRVLIPAGSEVRGIISSVDKAGRVDRKAQLTLAFDQITIDGRDYPIHGTVIDAIEGEGMKGDIGKIGTAAGVGAIIGGILGGVKGAIAGILIGGGGIAAATPGKDVELAPGTILRVRLDQPPVIRYTGRENRERLIRRSVIVLLSVLHAVSPTVYQRVERVSRHDRDGCPAGWRLRRSPGRRRRRRSVAAGRQPARRRRSARSCARWPRW